MIQFRKSGEGGRAKRRGGGAEGRARRGRCERDGGKAGESKMIFSKNMHRPTISDSFKMLLANMAV